ncbi:TlpA family protein disulfide reductase [Myxococcota bacterium]|nr:TlpA family protein disulfide reductase [Myxococcota bacterium]
MMASKRCSLPARPAPRAFAALLFSTIAALLATTPALALEAGDRAPDFSAPSLDGKGNVSLAQYRGKVVYLDFWASWCAPCLKAVPEIEAMRKELAGEKFQVVAVNLDQQTKKALRFLEKNPVGYPSASDPKGRLPKQFGVDTMPTSYLIDAQGVIRLVHRGFKRGDGEKLRAEIRKLLGGR